MLKIPKFVNLILKKNYGTQMPKYVIEQLKTRSLIRVAGPEAKDYLQGLITNDINHLGQSAGGAMYALFLNVKGRVLYDSIIYRKKPSTYLIECDSECVQSVAKHLKLYRVRKKVDINLVEEYNVHVIFNLNALNQDNCTGTSQNLEDFVISCDSLKSSVPETIGSVRHFKTISVFKDPRMNELGSRIISKSETDVKQEISELVGPVDSSQLDMSYTDLRYHLGVGEGLTDLPPGECFPLECNCDYLHGVSFHKGCYIGQELTARTYHTGVVRKRLMPLYFSKIPCKPPTENKIIHKEVNLGKLRGIKGTNGLALLRIAPALDFGEITVGDGLAKVRKPNWWPTESSKDRITTMKN